MKFESHLNYQRMIELPSEELRPLLGEIKAIVEGRIKSVLSDFDDMKNIQNRGPQDNKYVHARNKRSAYFSALDLIVSELNDLGHQLLPIKQQQDSHNLKIKTDKHQKNVKNTGRLNPLNTPKKSILIRR